MRLDTIINRDALCALRELPAESVHCCVTSPPYYALRDYGMDAQIGREDTPEQYIARLVEVFRELKWVHRKQGQLHRPEKPERQKRAEPVPCKTGGRLQAKGFNRYSVAFSLWLTPSMGSYPFWILATTCFFRVYRGGRVYCELTISQF